MTDYHVIIELAITDLELFGNRFTDEGILFDVMLLCYNMLSKIIDKSNW